VDFGEGDIFLSGKQTTVAFLVISLPYSDAFFCCAFPRECTEAFPEGHRRAFAFFGGVPRRIGYDNSRIAVKRIMTGRQRELTDEFLRLQSHYLFLHHFCLVRRPNEKGHVQNLIGFARQNFLVPLPQVDSIEALNQSLEQACREDQQRAVRGQTMTKAQLLAEEQAAFLPLPAETFEARRVCTAVANSLSLVRFKRNDYSVPTAYAHHELIVVGTIEQVRILFGDGVIATHRRLWGNQQVQFDPVHYLALPERKPGALDFARPMENWQLPECFGILRRRLEHELAGLGNRQFIKVRRLLEGSSLGQVFDAVQQALGINTLSVDAARLILSNSGRRSQWDCSVWMADRTSKACRSKRRICKSTDACWQEARHEQDPDQEHGAARAPPQDSEDAHDARRMREGGDPLRSQKRGPSEVPAATVRTGTAGSGTPRGGAKPEGRPSPSGGKGAR
jgi:hypothetical protein